MTQPEPVAAMPWHTPASIAAWAAGAGLGPTEVDCTTTVMLKILDGKCKMAAQEKAVIALLYDALQGRPGARFGAPIHTLIARARAGMDENLRAEVYEQRLYAETILGRPTMKAYKAMLRRAGVLERRDAEAGTL
jgi:hypothetical protein